MIRVCLQSTYVDDLFYVYTHFHLFLVGLGVISGLFLKWLLNDGIGIISIYKWMGSSSSLPTCTL